MPHARPLAARRTRQRSYADREQERQHEHHGGVPEGEPEAHAERPLAFGHQLAGGVVDRGDVVRIEGVAKAEGVGGQADPDREGAAASEPVVPGRDELDQGDEADDVQGDHDQCHHRQGAAL